jgi:hypothetical protein
MYASLHHRSVVTPRWARVPLVCRQFFVLLVSTSVMLGIQAGVGLYILIIWGIDNDNFTRRGATARDPAVGVPSCVTRARAGAVLSAAVHHVYPDLDEDIFFGLVLAISALVVAISGPLLQLLFFHIMLGTQPCARCLCVTVLGRPAALSSVL